MEELYNSCGLKIEKAENGYVLKTFRNEFWKETTSVFKDRNELFSDLRKFIVEAELNFIATEEDQRLKDRERALRLEQDDLSHALPRTSEPCDEIRDNAIIDIKFNPPIRFGRE